MNMTSPGAINYVDSNPSPVPDVALPISVTDQRISTPVVLIDLKMTANINRMARLAKGSRNINVGRSRRVGCGERVVPFAVVMPKSYLGFVDPRLQRLARIFFLLGVSAAGGLSGVAM